MVELYTGNRELHEDLDDAQHLAGGLGVVIITTTTITMIVIV